MLSISLPWQKSDDTAPEEMLQSVLDLGLNSIELGYTLSHEQIEAMLPLMKEKGVTCSSVHNFSPVPYDKKTPRHPSNYYRLTAVDPAERGDAVRWTKNSVDTAVRAGAPVVVIHAGMIELGDPRSPELLDLYKQGRSETGEFMRVRDQLLAQRENNKWPYLDAFRRSMDELMPYAREKNVLIGLETRYYPTEIPNFDEIGELLPKYYDQGMRYWHDVGHAEVNSRLGITPHIEYLKAYGHDMIGIHVHGVEGLRDHHAPFFGDFDLTDVFPFVQDDTIVVIESRFGSFDQLKAAVDQLKNLRVS